MANMNAVKIVKACDKEALVNAFKLLVESDHYEPVESTDEVKALRLLGVTQDLLREEILFRLL